MKKLELKEENKEKAGLPKPLTTGELLVQVAKNGFKDFFNHEIPLFYTTKKWGIPNFEEGEEWCILAAELQEKLYISVEVDNSYLDVEDNATEKWEVSEIRLAVDGNVFIVAGENDEELCLDKLSVEEIARIATALEKAYYAAIKK